MSEDTLTIKKHRENIEVNVMHGRRSGGAVYHNIIDRDPSKLAQVLMDLYLLGFPLEIAARTFLKRIETKDWLGL